MTWQSEMERFFSSEEWFIERARRIQDNDSAKTKLDKDFFRAIKRSTVSNATILFEQGASPDYTNTYRDHF